MRTLFLLIAALGAPALAHAGIDYKCDSVQYSDATGGWLRFGASVRDSTIELVYWNGYPPLTLVDAALATAKASPEGGTVMISEPDHHANDTVATIQLPADHLNLDHFLAQGGNTLCFARDEETRGEPLCSELRAALDLQICDSCCQSLADFRSLLFRWTE